MEKYFGTRRSIFLNWKKLEDGKCLNKYSNIKTDIEEKINNFNKIQHTNFYQEWIKLNKTIKDANSDIKDCLEKRHISDDLYAVDTIKNFSLRCPKRSAPTCRNNPTPHVRESPSLKVTAVAGSCTKGKACNKETAAKSEEKPKLQTGVRAGNPKRTSSPRLHTKDERLQHPTEKEPIDTSVISQAQPINLHTAPIVAEVKVSEDKVQRNSITSEPDEAQEKHLAVSEPSKVKAEETPPKDRSVQYVLNYAQETGPSSAVMDSGNNNIQSKLPCNETFDGNLSCQQLISDQFVPRNGEAVSSNIRDTPFMTAGVSLDKNPSDRIHVDASAKGEDFIRATFLEQPVKETTTETVSDYESTINSADSEITHSTDGKFSNEDTDAEIFPDKTFCTEESSDKLLSSGAPCNAQKGNELVADNDNKSDFFGKIFEVISNKDHIIKTSAPIGIALLLGLLFKVTPLWRVLTKKNRKKAAGISEELNSVLQEPSIMDDERSIPFSYGAFEYSSFDQNSY